MQNSIPYVSIIVPTYNVEKYLERCVESLLNQTLKNIEIILVDDGSTDKSGILCDSYAQNNPNIKVIHRENGGLGVARNSGLEIAQGKYVGFVDSDDFVSSEMFERLYNYAIEYDADISYGAWKRFADEQEVNDFIPERQDVTVWKGSQEIRQYLLDRIGLPPSSLADNLYGASVCGGIFRRQIIEEQKLKFVSERKFIAEDMIFDIDMIPYCQKIVHCNDQVYFYRYNPTSLTTSYKGERFDRNVDLYHEMNRRLYQEYKQEECFDSMARYFLSFTRVAIIQEIVYLKSNGYKHAKKRIFEICNNKELQKILEKYNYKRLPAKFKIYCWAEKHKCVNLLIGLTYYWRKLKGKN